MVIDGVGVDQKLLGIYTIQKVQHATICLNKNSFDLNGRIIPSGPEEVIFRSGGARKA